MIEKIKVLELVQQAIEGTDKFVVGIKITPSNRIYVDIDGDNGVNIDDCSAISRAIESGLDRDEEDFELCVSSAGADSPLKFPRQYHRHVGRQLSVDTTDDNHYEGVLEEVGEDGIRMSVKGAKKHLTQSVEVKFDQIRSAVVVVSFK